MEAVDAQLRDVLAATFGNRRIVLAGGPVAGATGRVASLRLLGARRCLVIGAGSGTGPPPEPADADVVEWNLARAADLPGSIRAEEALFANLPAPLRAALDRFDPSGDALVLTPPFAAVYEIAGRPVYGGRRPEWVALEDKTTVDALFAAAGITTPPFTIVDTTADALHDAHARLDEGDGTVWSGDARQGFNGGAAYVRWVTDERDAAEAVAHFQPRCARVRVARFVDGLPCSIHGFVTDDGVAVFRPVELMTLRSATAPRLRFAGAGTVWDPPDHDRDDMRDAAMRLGRVLCERVGFRGVFTIDGILGVDGWAATECNPRFGAALQYARVACPDLPLDLVHHVVIAGDGRRVRAPDLEDYVVAGADATRWAAAWTPTRAAWDATTSVPLAGDEHGYEMAAAEDDADATLTFGPGPMGGFVRCEFTAARVARGGSMAPRAVAALGYADARHDAGIGPLTAAPSLR